MLTKLTRMFLVLLLSLSGTVGAYAQNWSDWSLPENIGTPPNNDTEDYQEFITKDGLSLYFARIERPSGNQDIWVSHRASTEDPWGEPERLPATINTPTRPEGTPFVTVDGHWLFFAGASNRAPVPGFGGNDIWLSYRQDKNADSGPGGWQAAVNLGPNINTALGEAGPWLFEDEETGALTLYFHRRSATGDFDLYSSTLQPDGSFAPAQPITELNFSPADDNSPSVSHNGRELYFASDRPGSLLGPDGLRSVDIWVSRRDSTSDPWSTPEPVAAVNTGYHEGRPCLSWDGSTLYFFAASRPENVTFYFDIWKTTRTKLKGPR